MKKLFTLLSMIAFVVLSCKKELTPKEITKQNIEKYFLETANDPSSYEFVSLSELDTIYKKEHYKLMTDEYEDILESVAHYPEKVKKHHETADKFRSHGKKYEQDALDSEKGAKELQDIYDEALSNKEKFQKLYNESKDGDIMNLKTTFKCRANNKLGAKILATYNVELTDSLTVISMEQE